MAKRKTKQAKPAKSQDERRSFPRVTTEHAVEMVDEHGATFPAIALDLSLTGMQLLCDKPIALKIMSNSDSQAKTVYQQINVRMRFRTADGGQVKVQVICAVMATRQTSKDEYHLGLRFVEFFADSYTDLESYIDEVIDLPD